MDEPTASTVTPAWMAGREQLPWSWAVERLETERNYWLVTVRKDGFPQARPVWGVWSELGLFLSVGGGGLRRTTFEPPLPITVHVDDAVDVVILEGVIDRIVRLSSPEVTYEPTLEVDDSVRRAAVERYNAKYSWNFEPDTWMLNYLVRPRVALGWHSDPTEITAATKWTFAR